MNERVSAEDLAARLGTSGRQLRAWLRQEAEQGHSLLGTHRHYQRWIFTTDEADQLAAEYRRVH